MPRGNFIYSRPFKFVLVGDCGSGKTALIRKFLSECGSGELKTENENDTPPEPTLSCERHTVSLQTTIEHVRQDAISSSVTLDDIAYRLWHKKYSNSSFASQWPSTTSNPHKLPSDISWSDISVRLHQSSKQNRQMHSGSSKAASSKPTDRHCDYASLIAGSHAPEVEIDIWDTAGDNNFMWCKWYACTDADAVLLCIPLSLILSAHYNRTGASPCSKNLDEIEYIRKLLKLMSDETLSNPPQSINYRTPPVLLVGTKSDQRDILSADPNQVSESTAVLEDSRTGLDLAAEIGCCDFIRCSSLTGSDVTSVFETAIAISLTSHRKYRKSVEESDVETSISDAERSMANEVKDPTYFKIHCLQDKHVRSSENIDNSECKKHQNSDNNDVADSIIRPRSPRIYFPPPPSTSPPSTGPPSTCSSKTISSSSLESVSDFTNDLQLTVDGDIKSQEVSPLPYEKTFEDNAIVDVAPDNVPTPVPRIRRMKEIANGKAEEKTSTVITPKPKMRSPPSSATKRRTPSKQKRREGIFIKFLQAK